MKRHLVGIIPLVCLAPNALAQEAEANGEVPETYMVQPGDTLWDISSSILQNPWYWPKIWSYNPDITNPHMIYPGDRIRFTQNGGEQMPTMADYAAKQAAFAAGEGNNGEEQQADNSRSVMSEDSPGVKNRSAFEIISDRATSNRTPGTVQVMVESLVTPEELENSGVVYKSAEEKILLTINDKIYLKFPEGQAADIGEHYLIFRTVEQIKHPKTKKKVGYLTQITGTAEVINVNDKVATAIIRRGNSVIERGQFVTPLTKDVFRLVEPKANENTVRATILANKFNETELVGEQEIVFLDKGAKDGVALGNTFNAIYQGDPLFGADEDLPEEVLGTLRVVDVKDNVSTCLVLHSSRELEIGTVAVMKP